MEIGNLPEKEYRIMMSKEDPGSWENNGKDARNIIKHLEELKNKQTDEKTKIIASGPITSW